MRFLRVGSLLLLMVFLLLIEVGCGDQYRPVANPIQSPGGQPQNNHYAWVVSYNPAGAGSTTQIDVSGDTNLSVNAMGAGSVALAFPSSSLALYVANSIDDTVNEYLPTFLSSITTVSLLPGSHPVALTSATNTTMYALNAGTNSACPDTGSISTISTFTQTVNNTTCVGLHPTAMVQAPTNKFIYIINQGDNTVSVFDPSRNAVTGTITTAQGLGMNPVAIAVNQVGWIFIVTQGDGVNPGALDILGSSSTAVGATVPLGVQPTYAVVDPNRNRLYVANSGDNTVSVFDSSNVMLANSPAMPLLATVPVGTTPIGIAALGDGSKFYVANSGSNDVTVVSANSFSPLTTVPLPAGANPVWIAAEPTSTKVYVADQGTGETTIIQTSNNAAIKNIPSPPQDPTCTSSCTLQSPLMIVTE